MSETQAKSVKSHCNGCLQSTNHDLIAQRVREWVEEDDHGNLMLGEKMVYDLVQCRGCENISLRRTHTWSASSDVTTDYFPPAVSRKQPKWLSELSFCYGDVQVQIRELLHEVYSAIFSGNNRLALMGTRAIVDVVLTDKLGDTGGFGQKLKKAKDEGWITESHFKVLDAAIEAGNAAAHRAYKPDIKQLNLVLDIVEHLIQSLHVLEASAQRISAKTPPRPPRPIS